MCAFFYHYASEYSWESFSTLYWLSTYFCLDSEDLDMGNDIPLSQFPDNEIDTEDEVEEINSTISLLIPLTKHGGIPAA